MRGSKDTLRGHYLMPITRLLVANRGEIAIRIMRSAAARGIETVAVYSEDDATSLHTRRADEAHPLSGIGARAYLDIEQVIGLVKQTGCDAIHPGYGFLAENAAFARRCAEAGIRFVGPSPEVLDLFGNKGEARAFAKRLNVPVLAGTEGPTSLEDAQSFMASLGEGAAVMVKAIAGGGGRGMRMVERPGDLEPLYQRCQSEAASAFGNGDVYVEQLIRHARHIEVQVAGDGSGEAIHLWERECSLQRRNQKLVEIAPAPGLDAGVRERLLATAARMAGEARFDNIGTFEFLVDADASGQFAFIEANPRLQVEHTVTETVTSIDLVDLQLSLAEGASLRSLGLTQDQVPAPRGSSIQLRINLETMAPDGSTRPGGGTITAFEVPSGPGIRVDTFGYSGYTTSPNFDSLLAKLIVSSPSTDFGQLAERAYRALSEFRIEGVQSNVSFLQGLLRHPKVVANHIYTRFIDDHAAELTAAADHPRRYFEAAPVVPAAAQATLARAGAAINSSDPLAVLAHGKVDAPVPVKAGPPETSDAPGILTVRAPMQGTVVAINVAEGDLVRPGQQVLVLEAMKMEHVITAEAGGKVRGIAVQPGMAVFEGTALVLLDLEDVGVGAVVEDVAVDLDRIRPDLAEVFERHAYSFDKNRPAAVARRRKTGQRTARENVDDICDPGTFIEYGALALAGQRRRREMQDLIENTPGDGVISGIGSVNGTLFPEDKARTILMSYDYTVLAGTQGMQNHRKKDRLFELAEELRLPVVFFAEGGGGRPGDTDGSGVAGLDCLAFAYWGGLSGLVPLVGITSGRCFAGNAAILGCCDVVIATEGSNIGMGGPAMIEGGGLGVFRPEEVGPLDVQVANGVVDVAVKDEAEAVAVAKKYLSYFQGAVAHWECADQRLLRSVIPENRLRIYDVRDVIRTMADTGSVLELRRGFGHGMVTAFARIEGRPVGIIANNPSHLAGAIDPPGADKASRFMQLCDAFDIPIVFLCDTPGIMVGPEIEKQALVRHASRMFVTGASLTVPFMTIVLRKGYGLGAQAMAGGSFKAPLFCISWPTGEFGGMGLEGAVKLGYRNELAAIEDPTERKRTFDEMVDRMYRHGKAVNMASHFEIDDVIDPLESRFWISRALKSAPPVAARTGKKRPMVDTW